MVILSLGLGSCEFFTTSWGTWAARDVERSLPDVNAENVDALIALYAGDQEASLAVLEKIGGAVKNSRDASEKAKLRAASLDAALNGSGLVNAFYKKMGILLSELANTGSPEEVEIDDVFSLFSEVQHPHVISEVLRETLPKGDDADFDRFAAAAGPAQMALTGLVVMIDELDQVDGTINNNITGADLEDYVRNRLNPDGLELSEGLQLAVALIRAGGEGIFSEVTDEINNKPGKDSPKNE
jgi:hypothetical protein